MTLSGSPANAADHHTQCTISATGGVSFTDGTGSKQYDNLEGVGAVFKADTHGEIEFRFGGVFAGKIIIKAYPRKTLKVRHVSVAHVDPHTGAVTEATRASGEATGGKKFKSSISA